MYLGHENVLNSIRSLLKGRGMTVIMFWSQERSPAASTCCDRAILTSFCRPGVTRAELRVAGPLSRGDRMALSTSSGPGNSTRCAKQNITYVVKLI